MRVLIVKTSSLGDLIHTLPAVSDAARHVPGIRFDWVAEEAFSEIPSWHPAVDRVIRVAIRRWRKNWSMAWTERSIQKSLADLRARHYDRIIDAQGLVKSAIVTRFARGTRYGMARRSCREPLASIAYDKHFCIAKGEHAINRVRELFARVFDYRFAAEIDYGLNRKKFEFSAHKPYLVFLHGSSWPSKLWPQKQWIELAALAEKAGFRIFLVWGDADEKERAREIASSRNLVSVLPKMNISRIAGLLSGAEAVVGVDTGLSHLAAALDVPGVILYLATDPGLTGTWGRLQTCLTSLSHSGAERQTEIGRLEGPNIVGIEALSAENVWRFLTRRLSENRKPTAEKLDLA